MNKSITFKPMLAIFAALMSCIAITACSNDDEPKTDESFKEHADFIKSIVLDENGEIEFIPSETEGVYLCPMNNSTNSRNLCESMLNTEWKGNSFQLDLGDYGTVSGSTSDEEGVFDIVHFNIKDLPKFTLKVASVDYCENASNAYPPKKMQVWHCLSCNRIYAKQLSKCPFCGSPRHELVWQ